MSKVVIGISGGLDSTHALLVCAKAMDRLGLPRANILAYTMPGFATSDRTLKQARELMDVIGCTASEIDIRPSCMQMLADIGHPHSSGAEQYDITYENVQAGERTSHLFRLANLNHGIVIGTGDLSELALGWCTYGVGDHMSHYNVNASVPKTLITHLVRWVAESGQIGGTGTDVLENILSTDISPELIPGKTSGVVEQKTESVIGPYELQDFNLYYTLRFGFAPTKVAFLALHAWRNRDAGAWPEGPSVARNQYGLGEISQESAGSFSTGFFAPASSNGLAYRMRRRSAPAARFLRAATGARRAIRRPPCGSRTWRVLCLKRSDAECDSIDACSSRDISGPLAC